MTKAETSSEEQNHELQDEQVITIGSIINFDVLFTN